MYRYLVLVVVLLALLLSPGSALAAGWIYAHTYAEVWSPAGTSVSKHTQTINAWQNAFAHSSATNSDASTQAWANASASLTWHGLNSWTSGGKIVADGDAAAWDASQGWNFWISIGGLNTSVLGSLTFGTIRLTTPATATFDADQFTNVDLNLDVDGVNVGAGSFSLFSDGSHSGSGWYADSFFDVFFDVGTNCWNAEYTGPASYGVTMPVGRTFWLDLGDTTSGASLVGSDSTTYHEVNLLLPQDYEFIPVPEPSAMLVMASGLVALAGVVRRRL